ncbi:transposase, IS204/IS1001/IS1096/IS1165 family protein, partial [mine drainage metagenome]
ARPGSGFTLLFEALVMLLAKAMPMRDLSRLVGEHDTRLWRVVKHYGEDARAKADFSEVETLAVDETSSQRGHNYITLVAEPEKARILFATVGRDSATIVRFREDFEQHGGQADAVKEIALDMSAAFIKGMSETFAQAALVFDRFHATKLLTDAMDEVRRAEQRMQPVLKNSRYLWLRNAEDLRTDQITDLSELRSLHLKTARAYNLKMAFQDFYDQSPGRGRGLPSALVQLGHPKQAAARRQSRQDDPKALA